MPIRSMTGYGAGSFDLAGDRYRVELRSVNHKTLEIRIRCPRDFMMVEPDIHKLIRTKLSRGFVDAHIARDDENGSFCQAELNTALFDAYLKAWHTMAQRSGVTDPPSVSWLASQEGVLGVAAKSRSFDEIRTGVIGGCEQALENLIAFRRHEGNELGAEIEKCLLALSDIVDQIERHAPMVNLSAQDKARNWLRERGFNAHDFSEGRLEQELILLAAKSDITEEVVRIRTHILHMRDALIGELGDSVGKRLGFLVQELFREATTIGSKANDHTVAQLSIEARCNIEKIREQGMNIE
ncbi:MAG: YicC family protein [Myxococcales bacterium]|nr:YicC family protein [Myxococcales bacterium]